MIESHLWLRFGAKYRHQILVFEPLFEEMNRTRRLLCEVGHTLEKFEIGLTIPHLCATGESLRDMVGVRLDDWRNDAAAAIGNIEPTVIASLRGGALIDDAGAAKGWWRFAPETGARIVRDLRRTQRAGETGLYAGHSLSDAFLADLEAADPARITPLRTVRLESDVGEADAKVIGSPLWRRAEPGEDTALAASLAADLATWTKQCAAS